MHVVSCLTPHRSQPVEAQSSRRCQIKSFAVSTASTLCRELRRPRAERDHPAEAVPEVLRPDPARADAPQRRPGPARRARQLRHVRQRHRQALRAVSAGRRRDGQARLRLAGVQQEPVGVGDQRVCGVSGRPQRRRLRALNGAGASPDFNSIVC